MAQQSLEQYITLGEPSLASEASMDKGEGHASGCFERNLRQRPQNERSINNARSQLKAQARKPPVL